MWFAYEKLLAKITDRRQAAYFDLGVEHGVAAARADQLRAGASAKKLADRLVREALGTNVSREDVTAAAAMAAWSLLGKNAGRDTHPSSRLHPST